MNASFRAAFVALSMVTSLAFATPLSGCLPQDGEGGDGSTTTPTPTTGSYSFIRIIDASGTAQTDQPGADIDAIVVFAGGETLTFLSAGCSDASLFGENTELHGDNPNLDPTRGTLSFKEASVGGGFVSLGGGTLFCELPLPVSAGDRITIYEMEDDKADAYRVILAEDPSDGETVELGTFTGSAEIDIP